MTQLAAGATTIVQSWCGWHIQDTVSEMLCIQSADLDARTLRNARYLHLCGRIFRSEDRQRRRSSRFSPFYSLCPLLPFLSMRWTKNPFDWLILCQPLFLPWSPWKSFTHFDRTLAAFFACSSEHDSPYSAFLMRFFDRTGT